MGKDVLAEAFFFSSLAEAKINLLIDTMEEVKFKEKDQITLTELDADYMFVVEKGEMVRVQPGKSETFPGNQELEVYDVIGEVDLASDRDKYSSLVVAVTECVLWQLDRRTFSHVMKDTGVLEKRSECLEFLKGVSLL